jgi:hypothetical protein
MLFGVDLLSGWRRLDLAEMWAFPDKALAGFIFQRDGWALV